MFISYIEEDAKPKRWSCPIPVSRSIRHSGIEFDVSARETLLLQKENKIQIKNSENRQQEFYRFAKRFFIF